ncbi:MAG: hypothetical protein KU38_05310 [Sulfurovum sp. FS08-3]|nr:MAG: hypothetical protein KU38_05310 [Sulfurovum sp. FS08-3]
MHQTHITIDDDMFSKVQNVSQSLNITVSDFIRKAINNELKRDKKGFEKDKKMLHQVYQDVLEGKANLVSHDKVWEELDSYREN